MGWPRAATLQACTCRDLRQACTVHDVMQAVVQAPFLDLWQHRARNEQALQPSRGPPSQHSGPQGVAAMLCSSPWPVPRVHHTIVQEQLLPS